MNSYLGSKQHIINLKKARSKITRNPCQYCNKSIPGSNNLLEHERSCYLNPNNLKLCVVCQQPIKKKNGKRDFKKQITCSYACSNTKFRSGPNHCNWSEDAYRSTCFHFHKKECIICKEKNIVEVHHLDENNKNNKPENLIPLCPTHHQYWHSRYKNLIEQQIQDYINKWSGKRDSNSQSSVPKTDGLPDFPISR